MRIVVVEHLTSAPAPPGAAALVREGRAMRDAVAEDLRCLPGVRVTVLHRRGLPPPSLARLRGREVRGGIEAALRDALRDADAALVLAPEERGCLARLASLVVRSGRRLLGPSPDAIRLAGDKLRTVRLLAAAGIAAPPARVIRLADAIPLLAVRPLPFVLKPRDGCGARGVVLVRHRGEIGAALAALRRATGRGTALVQEFVAGDAASVSVVAARDRIVPLGLNRQRIVLRSGRIGYRGGETPWRHPGAAAAIETACAAVRALARSVPGVTGYLGVDLVLARSGPVVIEINPRLTTSYVGLRRALPSNPAALLLAAALGRPLADLPASRVVWRYGGDGVVTPIAGRRGCERTACLSA
jgi:tyramine---L-glutamate ligase